MKNSPAQTVSSLPLPGVEKKRGRPVSGNSMTSAQRQKAYRERLKEAAFAKDEAAVQVSMVLTGDAVVALRYFQRNGLSQRVAVERALDHYFGYMLQQEREEAAVSACKLAMEEAESGLPVSKPAKPRRKKPVPGSAQ